MTRWRVSAPYVTVVSPGAAKLIGPYQGTGLLGFHQGAILPEDVPQADLERLVRKGLIAPVEATE